MGYRGITRVRMRVLSPLAGPDWSPEPPSEAWPLVQPRSSTHHLQEQVKIQHVRH